MVKTIEYIVTFVVLILLQVFIFDNINILGYVSPYIYILIIIMLPMQISTSVLMLIGFGTGAIMDLISGNAGLSVMVTTWIAFTRPFVLEIVCGRDTINEGGTPSIKTMGRSHFIVYISLMTLLYNTPYFLLENMTLTDISHTALRVVFSSIFTATVIYFSQFIIIRKNTLWQ